MTTLKHNVTLTVDEYLEGEKHSPTKHEFVGGRLYAMVGVSVRHNQITGNLFMALRTKLRGGPCRVFVANVKVRVGDDFYYPDVMVACDPADQHEYYRERPRLIIEVLSASTETWDTTTKRAAYQSLDSMQEYVLVSQDKSQVRVYRRSGETWDMETYTEGETVRLTSIDLDIPIATVYEET